MRPSPLSKGQRSPARDRRRPIFVERHRASDVASRREVDAAPALAFGERRYRAKCRFGFDLEHQVFTAFAEPAAAFPPWFRAIRPATYEEDQAGVDLWVTTESGDVAVQVKSSSARARIFLAAHAGQPIGIVVLHPAMTSALIRVRVLAAVAMAPCQAVEAA